MRKILFAAFLTMAFHVTAEVLPWAQAREQAKKQNKPVALLVTGSEWLPKAQEVKKSWDDVEKVLTDKAVWAIFVETAMMENSEVKEAHLPVENYNLPEVILADPQGRLFARIPAASVRKGTESLKETVNKKLKAYTEHASFLEQAKTAQGEQKAQFIGKALDKMAVTDAVNRNDLINDMKKADPDDKTGYVFKYELGAMPRTPGAMENLYKKLDNLMSENGKKKGNDRNFEAATKFLKEKLELPVMDSHQKQQLLVALAYVARNEAPANASNKKMLKYYKEAAKINPKSELGKGAQGCIDYFTKEITLYGLDYASAHMRREFVIWKADVSKKIKTPGIYSIKFVRDGGGCDIAVKNVCLTINNKTVAELPADRKDKPSKDFELTLKTMDPKDRVELRMEVKGNGHWLDSWGHIEITKK